MKEQILNKKYLTIPFFCLLAFFHQLFALLFAFLFSCFFLLFVTVFFLLLLLFVFLPYDGKNIITLRNHADKFLKSVKNHLKLIGESNQTRKKLINVNKHLALVFFGNCNIFLNKLIRSLQYS